MRRREGSKKTERDRRMHRGASSFASMATEDRFMLLSFVPFVGAIALLVMMCMPTKTRDNKYAK